MADDSEKQDAPKLPPKLNLRKQGVLKPQASADTEPSSTEESPAQEVKSEPKLPPQPASDSTARQRTSRLVVKPAAPKPAEPPSDETEQAPVAAPSDETNKAAPVADTTEATETKRPTIKLKPRKPKPAAAAAKASGKDEAATEVAAAAAPDTKRKTSRIPLDSAKKPTEANEEGVTAPIKPKTIKIKPNAPVSALQSTQPLSITVPIAEMDSDKIKTDAEKRKTSRIPLDEALTADKESDEPAEPPADPARPKTIKIKRPGSESATVKVKKPAPSDTSADESKMGKTARLDTLPVDEADTTPTQKKTIRVKRPDAPPAATATPSPGIGLAPPEPVAQRPAEPGVVWAILALAASIVLCVVIYMFAAQAFGPNVSGTALSSWPGGPNLSWPGKILN